MKSFLSECKKDAATKAIGWRQGKGFHMMRHLGGGHGPIVVWKEHWKSILFWQMVDFLKAEIRGPSIEELLNHPLLNFKASFDVKTGEASTETLTADHQYLKFIIKDGRYINLQGSLHKYYTNGNNYSDFRIGDIQEALANLTEVFSVDLNASRLHNLEFGLNVEIPFTPHRIIKNLINYKGEIFDRMYGEARRSGKQVVKQQYILKIYNKGFQCNLNRNLLRVETKVTKMKYLEKLDIKTLYDLTLPYKIRSLMDDLVAAFEEVLMYDDKLSLVNCRQSETELLSRGRYPEYWQDLKTESEKMHDYLRRRFRKLLVKYGQGTQYDVLDLMQKKIALLLRKENESLAKLTGIQNLPISHNNPLSGIVKGQVNLTNSHQRICPACGGKIINRKSSASFCSEECRIKSKNRRRDVKRPLIRFVKNNTKNPVLFNTTPYLSLTDEQIEISKKYGIYKKLISA